MIPNAWNGKKSVSDFIKLNVMKKFAGKFRIGSHRLKGWNYANEAAYFITVVTQGRQCILGQIVNKKWFYQILVKS